MGMLVEDYSNPSYLPARTTIKTIDSTTDPDHWTLTLSLPASIPNNDSGSDQTLKVLDQYAALQPLNPTATFTPTAQTPVAYAQEYTTGNVSDNGSSMTLSVGGTAGSTAIDAITYTPLAKGGTDDRGAGMDFQVSFSNVPANQQLQLVVWLNDSAASLYAAGLYTGSTIGYMSKPLFTMNSASAGTTPLYATISLGGYLNSFLATGPFNTLYNSTTSTNPIVPPLGFTLVGNVTNTASVTVTNMNQFAVATGS